MEFKTIYKKDFKENRLLYLELIKDLYDGDNDKIANISETTNYLDFIFSDNYDFDSFLILQIENNKIIAMISGYEYDTYHNDWCLCALFIRKEYRGEGLGKKIVEKVFEEMKKYNYSKIIIGIEEDNIVSRKLFLNKGFIYANKNWDELAEGFPKNHLGYYYENSNLKK